MGYVIPAAALCRDVCFAAPAQITYNGGFNSTAHVNMSTWDLFAGLAIHDESGTLYAIARESSSHDCYIVKVRAVSL